MSQANVDSVMRGLEAWNSDDFDGWIDQFDPEVHWSALMEEFQGHVGAQQAWASFKRDGQLQVRCEDIRDLGDSVLFLGEITTTGRTTRLTFSGKLAQLFTFHDGKVVRVRDFPSHAEGLAAAGLSK
jgi:ketosteroid isomerase-like protein